MTKLTIISLVIFCDTVMWHNFH